VNFLSFEKFLEEDLLSSDFGRARYVKSSKMRQHMSKRSLDADTEGRSIGINEMASCVASRTSTRYIACTEITYDAILSIYDVDTCAIVLYRFYEFDSGIAGAIQKELRHGNVHNFEARLIGMQNGQWFASLHDALALLNKARVPVLEVDLFGTDVRNVAYDLKTGMNYDILMENKPYKPGERMNTLPLDGFKNSIKRIPVLGRGTGNVAKT
jgi:hypothetical protein